MFKHDLINNTVDNCIHLLIHNNSNYFDDFITDNCIHEDFYQSFDEVIIFDIRELIMDKIKRVDETISIYIIVDNTLDYIFKCNKADFLKQFESRVKRLYKFTENDSAPLYTYQY